MSKLLHTTEHFLGLLMIMAIFGLAVLSVWSLSPVAKDGIQVAGLATDNQVPANDLTNLKRLEIEVIPTIEASAGDFQAAYVNDREIVLRSKLNSLQAGETTIGRVELSNTNLFAFPVKVELVNFDQTASEKVVVILAASNGKHQLNRLGENSQPLLIAVPGNQEPSGLVLELVASENINFESNLEIRLSY